MNHIALDLELEQPYNNPQTPDSRLNCERIIQVGWVVFKCEPEFEIIKKQSMFVNIYVPLSEFIKNLTGISDEDIKNGGDINEAYSALVQDLTEFKCLRVIKQWGGGDMACLQKELPDVKWEFGQSACNVKHLYQTYAEANSLNRSGGLSKSMGKCNLTWKGGGKHNAMVDALNTARFYNYLMGVMKCA